MAVIDAHCHIYPEDLAEHAVASVGAAYQFPMFGNGTAEDLLTVKDSSPITNFFVFSVATSAHSVETINTFIAEECSKHPEFTGFMAMHQDYPDPEREIDRAASLGLKGMKLHPDVQQVNVDDPRLMKVYEIMEGRLPVYMHMGDYRYDFSHPRRLINVMRTFPNLTICAAHFGFWSRFELGYDLLHEENLFVDMSSTLFLMGQRRVRELTRMWGTDRVIFGADYPMWDPVDEYRQFTGGDYFTDDELENMLWHNAECFAGIKID